jgi:hypothetical protein
MKNILKRFLLVFIKTILYIMCIPWVVIMFFPSLFICWVIYTFKYVITGIKDINIRYRMEWFVYLPLVMCTRIENCKAFKNI